MGDGTVGLTGEVEAGRLGVVILMGVGHTHKSNVKKTPFYQSVLYRDAIRVA